MVRTAQGITMYGPNINLVRDPRWGRSQEVYGECPTLTGKLTVPFVRGAQGFSMEGAPIDANGTWLAGSCCALTPRSAPALACLHSVRFPCQRP